MPTDTPPFVIANSQMEENLWYVRRWDGSTSHQDVAVIVVFGKAGQHLPPSEVLDFLNEKLGAKTIEQLLAEAEDRHELGRRKEPR